MHFSTTLGKSWANTEPVLLTCPAKLHCRLLAAAGHKTTEVPCVSVKQQGSHLDSPTLDLMREDAVKLYVVPMVRGVCTYQWIWCIYHAAICPQILCNDPKPQWLSPCNKYILICSSVPQIPVTQTLGNHIRELHCDIWWHVSLLAWCHTPSCCHKCSPAAPTSPPLKIVPEQTDKSTVACCLVSAFHGIQNEFMTVSWRTLGPMACFRCRVQVFYVQEDNMQTLMMPYHCVSLIM